MKKQTPYKSTARYYDLIYSWKDYKNEADRLKQLIKKYKKSPGNELLDIACGTGRHIQYLKDDFSILATDVNDAMLAVARKNLKGVAVKRANMLALNLGKQFDAIVCLFSSIGYVKTYGNLVKTLRNFVRHLKKGGVVIIEPWITKSAFKVGLTHMITYSTDAIKIARLGVARVRGNLSILDMHHLVAEKNRSVKYFVERHELGLFETEEVLKLMEANGLQARFLRNGLMRDRGLFIGVKR